MSISTGLLRGSHHNGGPWGPSDWSSALRAEGHAWLEGPIAAAGARLLSETTETGAAEGAWCGQSNFHPIGALLNEVGGESFRAIVDRIAGEVRELLDRAGGCDTDVALAVRNQTDFGGHAIAKPVDTHADPISPLQSEGGPLNAPGPLTVGAIATAPNVVETVDAAANTGTAYQLQVGQTAQGTLASFGDRDWFAVDLQAGQTYSFAMTGTGVNNVVDPYLRLMDPTGLVQLQFDDDSLPANNSIFTYTPGSSGTYYVSAGAFDDFGTGQYGLTVAAGTRPSFDVLMGAGVIDSDLAWNSTPGTGAVVTYAFRASPAGYVVEGSDISTFTQLTSTQMDAVRQTLQAWSEVSGITFVEVNPGGYSDNATMLFANYSDPDDGAGAFAFYPGSTLAAAQPGDVWLNTNSIPTGSAILPGSYAYNAIAHEIGHAIGLAHPGSYNAAPGVSITYAANAQFTEDSNQYSIMSYFDEANTGAQFLGYPETPMLFDILSAQNIYGANLTTRVGDTTYGFNSNAGGVYDFSTNFNAAFAIWDAGGTDTLDASGYANNQVIDLNEGAYSTIGGSIANIAIALGAVIENAKGGSGNDTIRGNQANNVLTGNAGNDTMDAGAGNDTLIGGAGADWLDGGAGNDTLNGGTELDLADYSWTTQGVVVNLTLASNQAVGAESGTDQLISIENVVGGAGNDDLTGDATGNILTGNGGNDLFRLQFGGPDTVSGGAGDDSFLLGATLTFADTIDGGTGYDVVNLAGDYSGGVTFGAATITNIEAVYLTAGNSYTLTTIDANVALGQTLQISGGGLAAGNNLIFDGSAETNGRLDVRGGAGNDSLTTGAGNDSLLGGAGVNALNGNGGNDVFHLYFGGTDTALGGLGDDSFLVGASLTAADSIDGGAGYDVVNLAGNYALTFAASTIANVEALYLTAGTNYDLTVVDANVAAGQTLQISGGSLAAGNGLTFDGSAETNGRLDVRGGAGNDSLTTGAGNDNLLAGAGVNTLNGNGGNDVFHLYFAGTDAAMGGLGDDSFLMGASLTSADTIDGGTGYDVVNLAGSYAMTFAASTIANVEALYLTAGTSYSLTTVDANVAAGQTLLVAGASLAAANTVVFDGSAETDGRLDVRGGAGNDTLTSGAGNDSLLAGAGVNVLTGNGGNDVFHLYSGGTDTALGGAGDDSFLLGASFTSADTIDGGAGYDVVNLGGNYAGLTFGATTMTNVEALYLTAGTNYNLTLNDANVAAGASLLVTATTLAAANALVFDGSAETDGSFDMRGGAGSDNMLGGAGDDFLTGALGDDIFVFTDNGGLDQIADFDDFGDDVIHLSIAGVSAFGDVAAVMSQDGSDVLIDFATTDIRLLDTTLASVQTDDFMFV